MYGSVWWLNAPDHVSRTRHLTHLLSVLFVFKSCVVIVAHEVSKDKKKNKVTVSCLLIVAAIRQLKLNIHQWYVTDYNVVDLDLAITVDICVGLFQPIRCCRERQVNGLRVGITSLKLVFTLHQKWHFASLLQSESIATYWFCARRSADHGSKSQLLFHGRVSTRCVSYVRVVQRSPAKDAFGALVHAFTYCRLDYCNSVLAETADNQMRRLHSVQNIFSLLSVRSSTL